MTEANAVMALKNAWQGAVAASAQVSAMRDAVMSLPESATVADLDLDAYHRAAANEAMAVMALRGLIEELRRKRETGLQV
jgi:hypothetical protein